MILNDSPAIMLGDVELLKVYVGEEEIWPRESTREKVGVPPFEFISNGDNLIDWEIYGVQGGIGELGINRLKQREYTYADGLSNESIDQTKRQNIEIVFYSGAPVPPNSTDTAAYQQWIIARTSYIGDDRYEYTADDRPCDYQHCQFFATLPPGNYKLVCEYYHDYGYPWLLRNHDNENPYIALLTENNTLLVKKSMNQSYAPVVQNPLFDGYNDYGSPNNADFYHEEYAFTVSETTNVGFISKIYPEYNNNVFTRFQIVPADTAAVPFYIDADVNGVTCWEPYMLVIPVTISVFDSGNYQTADTKNYKTSNGALYKLLGEMTSQTINIPILEPLEEGQSVSLTSSGIDIPTYIGKNILDVNTSIKPTVKIIYKEE